MPALSEWLQIMLAEIARKREDAERGCQEELARAREEAGRKAKSVDLPEVSVDLPEGQAKPIDGGPRDGTAY